jgi:hypothetical protein
VVSSEVVETAQDTCHKSWDNKRKLSPGQSGPVATCRDVVMSNVCPEAQPFPAQLRFR